MHYLKYDLVAFLFLDTTLLFWQDIFCFQTKPFESFNL